MHAARKPLTALLAGIFFYSCLAQGALIISSGASSAVTSIDRSATFDSLNVAAGGLDLSNYSEDSLNIWVNDTLFADFDAFGSGPTTGFHYGAAGNNSWVTIETSDAKDMFGVEFLLGHGSTGTSNANVVWATYNDGSETGSGTFATTRGTIVGWSDSAGFDELRVGAHAVPYTAFGQGQAIALDEVSVQLLLTTVPLPGAIWLFGAGLFGMLGIARKRRK